MPDSRDESELRAHLALAAEHTPGTLDASRIIARSRARRLSKQIAAGSLGALALAGIFVIVVQVLPVANPASQAPVSEGADSRAGQPLTEGIKRAPADRINLCTGALAEIAPSASGLRLDVEFPPSASVDSESIAGTVRLTNTSPSRVVGTTPATPVITLSQGGTVLWHSNGPTILSVVTVDLAPGESLTYPASFVPARCGVEDDSAEAFRENLLALEPGTYELSALIDFTADGPSPSPELDLVEGPLAPIILY